MKIPKKISPDRIKDSIVEIRYTTLFPFEVVIGMIYNALDTTYTYTNRPLNKKQFLSTQNQQIELQLGNKPIFYNEKIKIELQPNSLIFNSVGEYVTWDVYKPEIEKALIQIQKANIIQSFVRFGIRYISEYPNINLFDCVRFTFSFGMPEITSESFTFHSEFKQEGLRVILNLLNNNSVITSGAIPNQLMVSQVSYIDIDVVTENLIVSQDSIQEVMLKIDIIHKKEKEVFFNLLKDEFLQSLNPVY